MDSSEFDAVLVREAVLANPGGQEVQTMDSSEVNETMLLAAIEEAQRRQQTIRAAYCHRGGYKPIEIAPSDTIETVRAKLKTAIFHIR